MIFPFTLKFNGASDQQCKSIQNKYNNVQFTSSFLEYEMYTDDEYFLLTYAFFVRMRRY